MAEVKPRRRYDGSRRREQAARNRTTILEIARRQFLDEGYAATTVPGIAAEAQVSVETVYKAFGGKAGVVRALWESGLAGREPVPAPQRSDELSATAADPAVVLRGWGAFAAELAPQIAPLVLLVRAAAVTEPEMASLQEEIDRQRRSRMRHNARRLRERGWLRSGIPLTKATDVLWTYSAAELYELLVLKSGWPVARYGEFVGEAMIAALLP